MGRSAISLFLLAMLLLIGGVEPNPGPFPCKLCSVVPETIASNIRHQQFHAHSRHFMFNCPSEACIYNSKSFGALQYHVSMFHREVRHQDPAAIEQLVCDTQTGGESCSFLTTSLWELVQHQYHHLDEGESVVCPIKDCSFTKNFVKKTTLQVHLSQYHKNWRTEGVPKQSLKSFDTPPVDQGLFHADDFMEVEEVNMPEPEEPQLEEENSDLLNDDLVYNSLGKFYLNLYAVDVLPLSTIQEVSEDIVYISDLVQARVNLVLTTELKKFGMKEEQIRLLCHKVKSADPLFVTHHKNFPGPSLTSDHLRKVFFSHHFDYIPPEEVNLNENDPTSDQKLQYISVKQTLTKLFEDETVQKEIDASFCRQPEDDNLISDYTSGSQYKSENHLPKEIQLFVYQDTLNAVMNALGSAKNKYKMLCMYFTLGNYRPYIRAKVDTKYVVLLVRESVFKAVGQDKCFERAVQEFKRLESEGICYKGENVKVVVQFVLGDSLGQHMIGGFIECFSAKFFCRFCLIMRKEFKDNPELTKPQRTIEEYNQCVIKAKQTGEHAKGVKNECVFNSLKYVHATSHLVPCLAHDLFEGVVSWDMAGIIRHFVEQKYFSYKLLNQRIKNFQCVKGDAPNKPAYVLSNGEKLGGHAVQNWTLLRLFPFIIGDRITDKQHPGWQLYLRLKKLCEWFCAPAQRKIDVPFIKDVLIPAYFQLRVSVLDQEKYPLKPKHHFMVHYAALLLRFGALIYMWTLSYEQAHKFFKLVMRMSKNFINPEYTCAVRNQLQFCHKTSSPLFPEGCQETEPQLFSEDKFEGELAAFIRTLHLDANWRASKAVCYNGLDYELNDVIMLSSSHNSVKAAVLKVLATKDDSLFFVGEVVQCQKKHEEGIYTIPLNSSGEFIWLSAAELFYPSRQATYSYKQKLCFSLKHIILEAD